MPRFDSIVLSAGGSRRLGTPKQALQFRGEALLQRTIRLARDAGASRVHVVTGARAEEDAIALADDDVTLHVNTHWQRGMRHSLACGAGAVTRGTADAALVMLVDQYRVDSADLLRLVAIWTGAPDTAVAASYADVCGVPALLPRNDLAALVRSGLRGRDWFARHAPTTVAMPHAAYDIDVPADVETMRTYEQGAG